MADRSERTEKRWWQVRLTPEDMSSTGLEMHETGVEADARDRAYVQNAYATLSRTHEIVMCGAWAGFQTGLLFLAVVAIMLVVIAAFAQVLYMGSFAREAPPIVDAFAGMLRPLLLLLPTVFFFTLNGAVAALMRRLGNRRRHALDHYFDPVRPLLDMLAFWLLTTIVVTGAVYALDPVDSDVDMVGPALHHLYDRRRNKLALLRLLAAEILAVDSSLRLGFLPGNLQQDPAPGIAQGSLASIPLLPRRI